jgi:hypothetical protein
MTLLAVASTWDRDCGDMARRILLDDAAAAAAAAAVDPGGPMLVADPRLSSPVWYRMEAERSGDEGTDMGPIPGIPARGDMCDGYSGMGCCCNSWMLPSSGTPNIE